MEVIVISLVEEGWAVLILALAEADAVADGYIFVATLLVGL